MAAPIASVTMANGESSDCGINDAYNEMMCEEDAENSHQDKQQVHMSMLRPGAGLRRPRLLAVILTLLAAVLLLVDIGLGVLYSKLTDGRIDDVTLINHELIRLQDDNKIAIESIGYANKQRAEMIGLQQLSKWAFEHQMKRKTGYEAQISKLQKETTTLQSQLTITSESCRRCSPGWILVNSLCYYIPFSGVNAVKTWQEARDFCKTDGGDLAIMDSPDKQVSIVKLLEMNVNLATSYNSKTFWIGLRDVHEEGTWKWLDGRTLVEGYWYDGEPNNAGDEDCVVVVPRDNPFKVWNDAICSNRANWICEMSPKTTSSN